MLLTKNRPFLVTVIILGVIAFLSSTQLTLEKIRLWVNPDYVPSCSFNPLFSCEGPMNSWQSNVFGIPNPIIGMVGFGLVVLIAFTALWVQLPKWYWGLFTGGVTLATVFIGWLITQSLYDIEALCLYCMIVWAITIPLFWLTWAEFLKTFWGNKKWVQLFNSFKWALTIASYFTVALMIFLQFQDFFLILLK